MAIKRSNNSTRPKRSAPARRIEVPDEQDLKQLQSELEANPHDVKLNRVYARALMVQGRFEEALECWHRIEETNPRDPKAALMIAKLIISKTRQNAGKATPPEPISTSHPTQKRAAPSDSIHRLGAVYYRHNPSVQAPEPRKIELTEWQKLQRAVDDNPGDVQRVLQLVDYYLQQGRHFDVERVLKKALSVVQDDPQLLEQWQQIRLLRSERKVRTAEQRTAVEHTPAARQDLQLAKDEYRELVLDLCGKRCEADPKNSELKIDMARRLQTAGDLHEALAWFERVSKDPVYQAVATLQMGECYQMLKRMPEALRHYRRAIELTSGDRSGCRPWALYRAASLALEMQLNEAARLYLSELVQIESDYQEQAKQLLQQLADY